MILSFVMGMITMAGCSDYLDSDYLFEERLNIEDVFTNKDYTNYWLANHIHGCLLMLYKT